MIGSVYSSAVKQGLSAGMETFYVHATQLGGH